MFNRWVEGGLLDLLGREGVGAIVFSPLAQGLLTDKYLHGIPAGSRAARPTGFLRPEEVTPQKVAQASQLNDLAKERGQTLAQMALAWVLRHKTVTSALIGASRVEQIDDAVGTLKHLDFSSEELGKIESILKE
jgi:L-glyceraldehyde 3-phosphate reductase